MSSRAHRWHSVRRKIRQYLTLVSRSEHSAQTLKVRVAKISRFRPPAKSSSVKFSPDTSPVSKAASSVVLIFISLNFRFRSAQFLNVVSTSLRTVVYISYVPILSNQSLQTSAFHTVAYHFLHTNAQFCATSRPCINENTCLRAILLVIFGVRTFVEKLDSLNLSLSQGRPYLKSNIINYFKFRGTVISLQKGDYN